MRDSISQSVLRLATGWTVRESSTGWGEIVRIRPDRPWGPPSLLHKEGVKQPERGVNHPPASSTEVKEYSYTCIPPQDLHGLF